MGVEIINKTLGAQAVHQNATNQPLSDIMVWLGVDVPADINVNLYTKQLELPQPV